MKVINSKVHGVLDYLVAVALVASPWLFGFYSDGVESAIQMMLGIGTFVYSLLTDYEFGIAKALSMKTHLVIDALAGLFLAASPWVFGFSHIVYLPHLVAGLGELLVVALSSTVAYQSHDRMLHV